MTTRAAVIVTGTPIQNLSEALARFPQCKHQLFHRFTCDPELGTILYIREVILEAGCICTTKIHRKEHPFVISRGNVTIVEENGHRYRLHAPFTGVTRPGTRRAIICHDQVVWTTFHNVSSTDLKKIEDEILIPFESAKVEDGSTTMPDYQPVLYMSPNIGEVLCLRE